MQAGTNEPADDAPTQVEANSGMPSARVATASSATQRDMLPDWLKDQVMHSFGAKLGRYALLKVLGEGGMGVVFAAYDDELDRKVAIKLLRKPALGAAWDRSWLRNEAKAMARLSHPNIVQVYDVAEADEQLFVAMEFVPGVSLQAWFRAQKRGWREVVEVCQQAGRGLLAAHEAGLVHRDFKPKYRRPSQTAPQPANRPHSHELGRFERVDVDRLAPRYPALPQVLAKGWQGSQAAHDPRPACPAPCRHRSRSA